MLTVNDYLHIRAAFAQGESKRSLARRLRHAQKTIRKVIAWEWGEPPPYRRSEPPVYPKLGRVIPIIHQILLEDESAPPKQRHTAMQMYRRLIKECQYAGKYDQVRRYLAKHRNQERETFVPLCHAAGQRLECDFGHIYVDYPEGRRQVSVLTTCWSFSHALFLMKLPNERTESVLHGLVCALEFFDCVCKELWWDNPKTLAWAIHGGRRRTLSPHFAALASHYRFEPLFCMPARGQEKSDAERSVYALERRFGTPVPQVRDDDHLNGWLLEFCRQEMQRTVAGRENTIGQDWAVEKAQALALPAHRFDACVSRPAVVDKYQTIRVEGCRYSVPREVAFRPVTVKLYAQRIEVVHAGRVVAAHPRVDQANAARLDPLHYLPALLRKPGALDHSGVFQQWELPPSFESLRATLEELHGASAGTRQYIRVLQLLLRHPVRRIEQAIEACRRGKPLTAETVAAQAQCLAAQTSRGTASAGADGVATPDVAWAGSAPGPVVPVPDLRRFNELLLNFPSTEPMAQGAVCDERTADHVVASSPQGPEAADDAGGVRQAVA
jgi:transposase